ncbi:Transducin beta-like protein 3 [Rhynchospora pubera]|uniref:Transducin beta-like protein 3 n=1 Tax=Rhynchospora pubera TaxID=906938 RepID=A0AAV8H6Y7_9POAL|nr:Transducin beta-like protein 3 [Rhynchospora pubera]
MATPPCSFLPKRSYRCTASLQQFYSGGPYAVSSDGSFLACACGDEVKIVSATDASVRATLSGDPDAAVTALALGPGDRLLFTASHSRLIRVWDVCSLQCIRSWKGHDGPVMAMACHSSGGLLATAGADKKVLVWDVDGGFCTHFFRGHGGVVTTVLFHTDPNKLLLFSGGDDGSVRIWNLESKKCVATMEKHFSTVTSLSLSQDGNMLLSSGRDKVVNVWDALKCTFKMTVLTYEMVETVCMIEPDHNIFACLGVEEKKKLKGKKKADSPSSQVYFLTVGERGIVRIWCSDGSTCIFEQHSSDVIITSDKEDSGRGFLSAIILPADQGLLCVTADQQFLLYRPIKSDKGEFDLDLYKRLVGYNEEILDMRFIGEDEKYLAVATNLEQVRVYDVATMSCEYVLSGHTEIVVCLDTCVASSGHTLLVTGSKDNTVRFWDTESRNCLGIGTGHLGAIGAVAFSKKSKNFFVSGSSDRTIKVWSFDLTLEGNDQDHALKARAVVAAHDKDINSLAVSPNDSLVCSGSEDRTACIWKLPDLVSTVTLRGHKRGVWSVEFSPVEQCVLTSSGDRTVKIWSISDGSCLKTFEGHTSSVLRASFLSRGTQFISCGGDGLVKLWAVKTNECIATYDQHEGKVWAMAVGKKTEMLATGGTDAMLNLWFDCTAEDKEEAFRKEEEALVRGQELENAVSDSDYTKAIQLAFELRRPHRLLDLFSLLCRRGDAEVPIEKALQNLSNEELQVLLEYIREWNTKPKLCHVAHFVLFRILKIFPPTVIMEIKGISELLEGLIPYSQRHFNRIDRLVRSTFLLDYTLTRMSVLDPDSDSLSTVEDPIFSDNKTLSLNDDQNHQNNIQEETLTSKKRKSNKSKKRLEKKAKFLVSN